MNIRLQMIDTDTGEILATKYANYALNFGLKNDAGFILIMNWVHSCVRGIRTTEHKNIELRVGFCNEKEELFLPFGMTKEQSIKNASDYVY